MIFCKENEQGSASLDAAQVTKTNESFFKRGMM
jgi:hypothetical protein